MRRRDESGYALLLVFLMAAVIALSLYSEIPRIAFETQRQKEQLLMERGHEYQRAIQVFFSQKGAGRYPASIDELENLNNRRYLRHRFVDPMTGKDDWRLIHVQNGVLTDSVTTKQKTQSQSADSTAGTYVGEHAGMGQDLTQQGATAVNLGQRRRASDNQPISYPGQSSAPTTDQYGNPLPPGAGQMQQGAMQGQSGTYPQGVPPGLPGMPGIPGVPGVPGAPQAAGQASGGSSSTDTSSYVGGGYSTGSQATPPNPFAGGQSYPGAAPGSVPQPAGTNPQMFGQGSGTSNPGQLSTDAQNAAAALIGNMLRSPRPQAATGNASNTGQTIGGGIAGIASKFDSDSIMVFSDRTDYAEWEFIFDPAKVKPVPNPLTGAGVPAAQMGNMSGQSGAGTPVQQLGNMPENQSQPITSFGQGR